MSVYNAGDFPANHTDVEIPFNTFTSDDPSASSTITNLATTDIHIHKDGSATQRTSDAGFTLTINMDGITGNHLLQIDLSDNTDAGFYAAGHEYTVRMEGTTVDGATINSWIGSFSIERAGGVLALIKGGNITVGTCTTNTDMRGTDSAALASVVGALNDAAAAGDPTDADTLVQYIKQLINVLIGTAGIAAFPAEAAPANAVSLAEVIRAIHADVTGLNGSAMRGTDNAATAAKLLAYIQLLARSDAAIETDNATELTEINADGGSGAGNFSAQTDAVEALRDHIGDGTNLTEAGGDGDHLTEAGGDGDHLTAINLPNQTMDITGNITGNLSGSVGSVTGDVGGNVDGTVAGVTPEAAGVVPTAAEIQAEMEENGASILDTLRDDLADGGRLDLLIDAIKAQTDLVTAARMGALTDWIDGGRLDLLLDAIPTTAMRGTDNAATEAKQDIIDTVVDAIKAVTDVESGVKAAVDALNDITVADIIAGIADGSLDLQEMLRIILAASACKSSGGATATIKFRDSADSKDRITATVDADGNRTAVTLDGS